MAFWTRLKQSQLKTLSNQIQRCYLQPYCASNSSNHYALHSRTWIAANASFHVRINQFQLQNHVRFFAAPVQAKQKEEKDPSGPRLNEKITAQYVRLVSDEGHKVVSRHEALALARRLKLDLVEVQRNAEPPVCKLMDYHKEKYKQQIKEKERSSKSKTNMKKAIVKEVRFSGQITQNDLQLKADTVKRLLEEGYRVKCMVTRKKAEDLGELLSRFMPLIEDVSMVENGPNVEEKQAHVIVRHVKLGAAKRSGKKAAGSVVDNSQKDDSNASSSYSEDDDGVVSADYSKNWTVSGSRDDFDNVFDVRDDGINVMRDSSEEVDATTLGPLFSPANRSMNPRPPIGLAGSHNASTASKAPVGTENRYRREPRSSDSPGQPMNGYGPSATNMRLRPPFMDRGRQAQFNMNAVPQRQEAVQHEAQPSRYGNAHSFSKQNSSASSPTTPSFGNSSAPNAESTNVKQNAPTEVNRYKQGNVSGSSRNSSSTRFSAGRNPPMPNYNGGQGTDNDGQGKFGIFSQ